MTVIVVISLSVSSLSEELFALGVLRTNIQTDRRTEMIA